MAATFSAVLTAYLLGNFLFRTEWVIAGERRAWSAILRAMVVTVASYLLLGAFDWRMLLVILLAHLVLETIQACWPPEATTGFLAGHGARLAVSLGLAFWFPDAAKDGWWMTGIEPGLSRWYFASLDCISGVILCVPAGGLLIGKLIRPFTDEISGSEIAGLTRGGQYIGWLERILVLLLVLMDQPNGIGFLIAAKSILRFGEIKDTSQRKVTEYIIIGTFLSFGWALLISALTRGAIRYWMR